MGTMDHMPVECSRSDAQLEADQKLVSLLPVELLTLIRITSGSQYLENIASAALHPPATDKICGFYRYLLPEITARWLRRVESSTFVDQVRIFSGLAKIIPFAPYLKSNGTDLLRRSQGLINFSHAETTASGLDEEQLHTILLAFFRLMTFDQLTFKPFLHPNFLSSLFSHVSRSVRYFAIQCFSQVMELADALSQRLVSKYVGDQAIPADWEGRVIDLRMLKLLEEHRSKKVDLFLTSLVQSSQEVSKSPRRTVNCSDLLPETASLGGILIPRLNSNFSVSSSLVSTETTLRSLREMGNALLETKPILLCGGPGSGKTALVLEAAQILNKSETLINLHLNEQTDAKSLLGLYTSSEQTGAFQWQPGILTQAVREGRWILIEDIDKAPSEVLGVIKPLLQDGQLYLSNRKETLNAAPGFRILATVKTSGVSSHSNPYRTSGVLGDSSWTVINVPALNLAEINHVISQMFPTIKLLIPSIMSVYEQVELEFASNYAIRSTTARNPSLRDLLKWCRRIVRRMESTGATAGSAISDATKLNIFMDSIDCFAAYLNNEDNWSRIASCTAKQMQIAPQQVYHSLKVDLPQVFDNNTNIQIGRSTLEKLQSARSKSKHFNSFAFTRQASMTINSIAAATSQSEPVLLVGETGVGKTTFIQYLASLLGQSLTVVNLSQQSEAGDLLGGLKPVTARSLVIPLADHFSTLFDDTFSAKKNEQFLLSVQRCTRRENWQRLLVLWQQAVDMAETSLDTSPGDEAQNSATRTAKRRKLDKPKYQALRDRWANFAESLNVLRLQITRTERHLTFSYVEGKIVQAAKQGGWLLLDEINLASSDTLDSIVSLLVDPDQESPYLHLTESGNIEKIVAHPEFRVFAAMNPATDTGKKDLVPSIRSRFTEIFVPAGDGDVHDLVKLIEIYLGTLLASDKRASFDLANLYLAIKTLNQDHQIVDGAGDNPHFTVRSLVRCLLYVQKHSSAYGLRRSLFEGACMTFGTMLSQDSERIVLPLIERHILSSVKNSRALLAQTPRPPSDETSYVSFNHHLVRKGDGEAQTQVEYIQTPSVERNLLNLARAASMHRFPILLQGPTSSGKTSMVEYLAKSTGNHFVRVNNHEHTDLQEYLGCYASGDDGRLAFREGVLVQAVRNGHWIVLDELNLAPSDVLEALNRLLDDNRELLIPETQEIIRPHPGFMLFATQNPAGLYGGRKRLSRAFRNRFLELHFDNIPEDELEVILQRRSHIAPSYCTQIVMVYKKLSLQRQSSRLFEQRNSFATLRDLFRWAARPIDDRTQLATQGFMLLGERVRDPTERQIVKTIIEEVIRVKIDLSAIYSADQIPQSLNDGPIVWTPAMRRLFTLVSKALENNEPVLLVGETGCGKTQICQTVSQAFGQSLQVYNAHTNTETGDLIGSQRPARHRAQVDDEMRRNLLDLLEGSANASSLDKEPVDLLLQRFEAMDASRFDAQKVSNIRSLVAKRKALFEWVDGSLVRAMKEGHNFLLDEISLAEDSVLERLNSLLEPSRTILLAEKGLNENLVVAAPRFQFLATMNPGGDYGKRELSAALRNRLTEIWVPPLAEDDDVLPIVKSKLIPDLQPYAKQMLEFTRWFESKHFGPLAEAAPLRNLISWAEFFQQNAPIDVHFALYHGAAMLFIDSLGANPSSAVSSTMGSVKDARILCVEKLNEITHADLWPVHYEDLSLTLTSNHLKIGHFRMDRKVEAIHSPRLVFDAPTTLKNTMRLVRAMQMKRPVLLEGNPGVGKTAIITALAQLLGQPLTRINLSDQTDLMDLFGADVPVENEDVGKFAWRNGPLLKAMERGGWVLLDEMNLASQSVLEGLNSCLDHRREVFIAELDRTFICHPGFKLFAAQNPHQQGGGRKGLPRSFVNRFTTVYVDPFENEDLYQICEAKFPSVDFTLVKNVVDVVNELQSSTETHPCFSAGGPWEFNLRDVSRWLQILEQAPSLVPDHYFGPLISQRLRERDQRQVAERICGQFLHRSTRPSLYHSLYSTAFQVGTAFLDRNQLWQKTRCNCRTMPTQILPYAQSVVEAINQKWPVILADCGNRASMSLVRQLAAIAGASLTKISLNADTDAIDLIGGLEQYDPQQDLVAVKAKLQNVLGKAIVTSLLQDNIPSLTVQLKLYSQCQLPETSLQELYTGSKNLPEISKELQSLTHELLQLLDKPKRGQVGFVWHDGVLVDALQSGQWLVLENANTCNPAVLDRLNSLLEPDGVLVLSEQHTSTNASRIIRPHPDFRIFLTMNPRDGELSRAMRNRSLELYIDENVWQNVESQELGYLCSSEIYRLRSVEKLDLLSTDSTTQRLLLRTWLDYVPEVEYPLLQDFANGESLFLEGELLKSELRARSWLSKVVKVQSRDLRERVLAQIRLNDARLLREQPFVPVNEPLIHLSSDQSLNIYLKYSNWAYHTLLRIYDVLEAVEQAKENIGRLHSKDRCLLDQSLMRGTRGPTLPFAEFLLSASTMLLRGMETDDESGHSAKSGYREFIENVLAFVCDILHLSRGANVRRSVISAYLNNGYATIRRCPPQFAELRDNLLPVFDLFAASSSLKSGKSLAIMWNTIRPLTASTENQLNNLLQVEMFLSQMDDLQFSIGSLPLFWQVKNQLVHAYCSTLEGNLSEPISFTSIEACIADFESDGTGKFKQSSYFNSSLKSLLQLAKASNSTRFLETLSILTSEPTNLNHAISQGRPLPRAFASLLGIAGASPDIKEADAWRDQFGLTMLRQMATSIDQPLLLMDSLKMETRTILQTMCAPDLAFSSEIVLQRLVVELQNIVRGTFACHDELMSTEDQVKLLSANSTALEFSFADHVPANHHFRTIYQDYFHDYTTLPTKIGGLIDIERLGASLVASSLGLLHLLVPDQPFDPALTSSVTQAQFKRRYHELTTRLGAQKAFQKSFTGQTTDMMIQVTEEELGHMGKEPKVISVVRPKDDGIDKLTVEFKNILRAVVDICPERVLLARIPGKWADDNVSVDKVQSHGKKLLQTTQKSLQRLELIDRAFDDLTRPIMWTLRCLALGSQMVVASCESSNHSTHRILELLRHLPLVSATPDQVMNPHSVSGSSTGDDIESYFDRLEAIEVAWSIRPCAADHRIYDFLEITHSMYDMWKSRLEKDQDAAALRSRYYTYRGEEDLDDIREKQAVTEMFPTFDENESTRAGSENVLEIFDVTSIAKRLARLQLRIFSDKKVDLESYIHRSIKKLPSSTSPDESKSSPIPSQDLYSVILLQLEITMEHLDSSTIHQALDVYVDGHIAESRKLSQIVEKVENRFQRIHAAWPEHAIPTEVLRFCTEVLHLGFNDPIAKLLTKTEKLLEIISQWQEVASREYSAAEDIAELIKLIIHWRQLELRSWSTLLDREEYKLEDSAQSWYFVLYEAIISNPTQILTQNEGLSAYLTELAITLDNFLNSSGCGEFSYRLTLCKSFETVLMLMIIENRAFNPVLSCLSNVILHHERFEKGNRAMIEKERKELERKLREQIKLASWKDTNIDALRESARRSHFKLFKIVRKYRALLSQPLKPHAILSDAKDTGMVELALSLSAVDSSEMRVDVALQKLAKSFPGWYGRPERLRDTFGAAARMRLHIQRAGDSLFASSEVSRFTRSLQNSMKDLRSRTPSTLTDDNKDVVNNLKSLKQGLFSDTLRAIKQMGIRRDLGGDEMAKQASLAIIFAHVPKLVSSIHPGVCADANNNFHEILGLMPAVRESLTEHSDQVRVADVRRSVSYAEGLLSVIIEQRKVLASSGNELRQYQTILERIGCLAREPVTEFEHVSPAIRSKIEALNQRLSWLPHLLKICAKVLRVKMRYSDQKLDELHELLLSYASETQDHLTRLHSQRLLPSGLQRMKDIELSAHSDELLQRLQKDLQRAIADNPSTAVVLQKLLPWTESITVALDSKINGFHELSLDQLDKEIRECLDMTFEAVQKVNTHSEMLPDSTETAKWLMKSSKREAQMLNVLQISSLAKKLQQMEEKMFFLTEDDLPDGISMIATALPILEQYLLICQYTFSHSLSLHSETTKMAVILLRALTAIASEGFCSPVEGSSGEEQSGPIESGTGLGDGAGAEDISNDIDANEDLSELAQTEMEKQEGEMEVSKDAVNMDMDELKGEDGGAEESADEDDVDGQSDDENGSDLDEETGSVDDLDPNAIDEKMWEGLDAEKDKKLESEKAKGDKSDEQTAKQETKVGEEEDEDSQRSSHDASEDAEQSVSGDEDGHEGANRDEINKADSNAQQENALDLPEEMQLNGEEKDDQHDLSDDDMAKLSDVEEHEEPEEPQEDEGGDAGSTDGVDKSMEDLVDDRENEVQDGPVDEDEIFEDQDGTLDDAKAADDAQNEEMDYDLDEDQAGDMGRGGMVDDQQTTSELPSEKTTTSTFNQAIDQPENEGTGGDENRGDKEHDGVTRGGRPEMNMETRQAESLKRLGNILEQWYQRREIHQAHDHPERATAEIDMADTDLEHLQDEQDQNEAQALGPASKEQAQSLDQGQAIEDAEMDEPEQAPADIEDDDQPAQESMVERFSQLQTDPIVQQDSGPGAIRPEHKLNIPDVDVGEAWESVQAELHEDFSQNRDALPALLPRMSHEESSQLWAHCSNKVHHISLVLTEQLRLILAPTLATKLRGDFRTGKRLNIKRIIPYIASGYKRDKIWMRRSVPSKRNYQIMLALDDSKSMMEGGAGALAFETLAMLCKSLSMLEVGDLCVIGFGNEEHIRVAHPFGQPFGNESGVNIFQNFTFSQTATDVRKMVRESIGLFQNARAKSVSSQRELWQLQLIISDGICEDHQTISKLVRQAKEERIMIVFVIVDGNSQSILDLPQANFEQDETGEMKLIMRRYLEKFPFPYYLVVRDVRDLPAVLATALKGWFTEVADVQG